MSCFEISSDAPSPVLSCMKAIKIKHQKYFIAASVFLPTSHEPSRLRSSANRVPVVGYLSPPLRGGVAPKVTGRSGVKELKQVAPQPLAA